MKSRACRSAAATLGCHKSTMKTTRGPSSAEPGGGGGRERGEVQTSLEPGPTQRWPPQLAFRQGPILSPGMDRDV